MVKDTRYILSFNDNEQLMLVIHKMHEVKQRAFAFAFAAMFCVRDLTRQNGLETAASQQIFLQLLIP